jgi:hypothetical protein
MPVIESSVTVVVRERARSQPKDVAFAFIDCEQDWDSLALSLTWSQLYRRARNRPSAKTLRFAWRPGGDIGTTGARLHRCVCGCAGGFAGLRDDRRQPSRNSDSTLRKSHWWTFGATSVDGRLTPIGGQRLRNSDLVRLQLRLLGSADHERAMEWLNPCRATSGGAAT